MSNYIIFTDSACDISKAILNEWDVKCIELNFHFEGEDKEYLNNEMDISEFYSRMKNGETAKTSAINPEGFADFFEDALSTGKDVLYLGFSSGLSTTFNSARIAVEELLSKYPDRKIITVDSLSASAGQGMLVYLAAQKQKEGASIEEAADYIESIKLKLCHWFTVDDLVYLKRGGRISPTVAFVGTVLSIKPVLHVDNEGKLVNVTKARGRKASLNALIERYEQLAEDLNGIAYICHSDCIADATELKSRLVSKYNADVKLITDIGPVIGAHAGPGAIAIFFIGKER